MPTRAADHRLRVLHLEDSELDHELTLAHLQRGGLEVTARRVDNDGEDRETLPAPSHAAHPAGQN